MWSRVRARVYCPAVTRSQLLTAFSVVGGILAVTLDLSPHVLAQGRSQTTHVTDAPTIDRVTSTDWPLHNLDLRNSRYAAPDQITPDNVGTLVLKWSHTMPQREIVRATTPLVIHGIMYFNSGSKLTALNAATGDTVWTFEGDPAFASGRGRGPAYGNGTVYAFGPTIMYAVDAKTGELVESFGRHGMLEVAREALIFKYPDAYPPTVDTTAIGYSMTNPPAFVEGNLLIGLPISDRLISGGLVASVDGKTGAIRWVFNTIPQGPQDAGWEIAKDTWSDDERYGGGVWLPPSVDPDLGMVYFNAANPSPNYDGSSRKGKNLFTDSMLAVDLETGDLEWYFQTLHHDIWDWDLASGPILFDVTVNGEMVKGVASLGKTCYVYILNRDTGQPINPIVETAVPMKTDVPGEEVWPTQPVPYTSTGVPQQPFCAIYPIVTDPELAPRVRQAFHPYQVNEFVIISPGSGGGASYGSPSFSRRTGLLYVTGKNTAGSIKVKPVGNTLQPGSGPVGHFGNVGANGETDMTPTSTLAAYDPPTGARVWYAESPGATNGGNLVTAGNIVFQGVSTGDFYGFDAPTGERLFTYTAERGIHASPLTYQINGTQYVAIAATNQILVFGLP